MSYKFTCIIAVVALIIGLSLGYYALPAKIVTKTVVSTQIQIVHDSQIVKHDNVVTVVTKAVDGSTITTTKDLSVEDNKSETKTDDKTAQDTTITKSYDKNYFNLGIVGTIDFSNGHTGYGAYLNRSILGPFTMGIQVTNNPALGVMVGVSF